MVTAAVMPMLIGAAAVGVDVGQWALAKRQLQRTADSAALAGAMAVYQNAEAKPHVDRALAENTQVPLSSTPVIENAPTVGDYKGDMTAVRVVLSTTPNLTFVSFFMSGPTTLTAQATAKVTRDPRFCMLALEKTTTPGFEFAGDANLNYGCGLMTNSRGNPAVYIGGSAAAISTPTIAAAGAVPAASNYSSTTSRYSWELPEPDPFPNLPAASSYAKNCRPATEIRNKTTLKPGCWNGLSLKADVTFTPGVYVINGNGFDIGSGAIARGEGVTFILTGPDAESIANVNISSNSTVDLRAPVNRELDGILMYQDRRAIDGRKANLVTGSASSRLEGALFFPETPLTFTGNGSMNSECLRIIARRIKLTGSSTASNKCPNDELSTLWGHMVRLID